VSIIFLYRIRINKVSSLLLAFVFLIPSIARSEDLSDLTVQRAVEIVVEQNLSLSAEELSVATYQAGALAEEGAFDPTFNFNLNGNNFEVESASSLEATEEKGYQSDMSVEMRSKSGHIYQLRWGTEWVDSNLGFLLDNPYYTSELSLSMVHPLLKNYGPEAASNELIIARNNLQISKLKYDETVSDVIMETIAAYWELFFTIADHEVARQSLDLAGNLLDEVKSRIQAGKLASIEIFKAEAEVAVRQETVNKTRKAVGDSADRLRAIMNLEDWDSGINPVDTPPDPVTPASLEQSIRTAFETRLILSRAQLDLENRVSQKNYQRNQKKPKLDFVAMTSTNSVEDSLTDVHNETFTNDHMSWSVGLNFSSPLGGGEASGRYDQAVYEEERAVALIKMLRQQIKIEVREAWRNLNLTVESIDSTEKTRIAARKKLQAEEEKFRVGKATLNDVLEFQAEFAKALSAEKRARADYAIAAAYLKRVAGTLR